MSFLRNLFCYRRLLHLFGNLAQKQWFLFLNTWQCFHRNFFSFSKGRCYSLSLKVNLGRIEYNFQKSLVTGSWDHKDSVSAKSIKKFHACVPWTVSCNDLDKTSALLSFQCYDVPTHIDSRYSTLLLCLGIYLHDTHEYNALFCDGSVAESTV